MCKIVLAGSTSAIDQSDATHVAVCHLVARQIDRVIRREVFVDTLVGFAVAALLVEHGVAAVILRQLLLDDVCFDRHAQMICLSCEVCGDVIVLVFLERRIAQVAPENSEHAESVRFCKRLGDLHDLAAGFR